MLIAVGLAIGFRANVWNIGAEGQFIMGASRRRRRARTSSGARASVAAAGDGRRRRASAARCGRRSRRCCGRRFNANEILVSLMLVYIAQLVVSWLVHGPWKDPEGFNFPQTEDVR